jgi:TldD protein
MVRELFASSEGTLIDRPHALTQGTVYVVAQENGVSQEHYDYIGHQRGWEILTHGISDPLLASEPLETFALELAGMAKQLCSAPPLKATEKPVMVVTDSSFNALVAHEVIGHPTEADRALKWETAYAGRSWLFGDMTRNQLGKQVASPLVTAYSDPSLPGFGHYPYDHEGTPGRRVVLIDKGFISGFMNSRETAAILGAEPNGHYKATDASLVPLIRMSTTVFANGDTPVEKLIGEVEHGWYVRGMRTPSISESRENFRISARKVVEIRKGQFGQVYRDGGITSDTRDFFMSIDGVGNDFRVYAIPNCGKGQPMQTKKLGNGGPTLRSKARLTGQ